MAALPAAAEVMSAWEKAAVIADSAAALGIVLTLFYSIWSFRTTLRDSYYAELDRVYFDLLKIGLEHPDLLDFPASPDPSKAREYDAYAFMVWNFLETVYDRCQGWSKRRLRETWYPVIASNLDLDLAVIGNGRTAALVGSRGGSALRVHVERDRIRMDERRT